MAYTADIAVKRGIGSARILAELALDHAMSPADCLAGTALSADLLGSADALIDAGQELQLVANLVQHLGAAPLLGLEAGQRYHLTAYGMWGFALISSRTLRSAVDVGLRYLDLTYVFCQLQMREEDEQFCLVFDGAGIAAGLREFLVVRDLVAAVNVLRELFAEKLAVRTVSLAVPEPDDPEAFRRFFGIVPRFGQAHSSVAFDARYLDMPLPQADATTAKMCEAQCRALLEKRRARTGLAARVRQRLLHQPGHFPTMEHLAAQMNTTTRTLRRHLRREGVTYRDLVEEAREALAEELVRATHLSFEAIAERLGYADVANFFHAFRRWKGMTPKSFRASTNQPVVLAPPAHLPTTHDMESIT